MIARLEDEIRTHGADFLAGKLEFDAFEDWLVSATWNLRRRDRSETAMLAYSLLGAITRYKEGELSEDALRQEIDAALRIVTSKR